MAKNKNRSPNPVTEAAARAASDLGELGARFALVGGLAVSEVTDGSSPTAFVGARAGALTP